MATRGWWPTTGDSGSLPNSGLRFATLMSLAADDAALHDDPEFRAAFVGYLEWGTRLAMGNSAPDAATPRFARARLRYLCGCCD